MLCRVAQIQSRMLPSHLLARPFLQITTPPSPDPFTHTYRWHSALRSSPGCIHTSRLCRSRARCSAGDTPVDRTRRPSSPRRSDSCPPRRCRAHHSRLRTALWDTRRGGCRWVDGTWQQGVKRKQIQELLSVMGRPRSTTLSDGWWKEIPATSKRGNPLRTIQI